MRTTTRLLCSTLAALPVVHAILPDWTPPLSTRGRYVVDATGARFKLRSGNWHGAHGTWEGQGDPNDDSQSHAGENSHVLALGLQYVLISDILDSFEQIGVNSIRLTYSNEMIHDTSIIQDDWVAANPQLRGKTHLEVYDAVVKALSERRFAIIINNHLNKSLWGGGIQSGNERWNSNQTEEQWIADWVFMTTRYKDNKRVAGADLYNEVRRDLLIDPNWGGYDKYDWYLAAQHAADKILGQVNPDLLIIIEGINWTGLPIDGFPHGRPTITPAATLSHTLLRSNKLVYSAHFYAYTGPHHSGATGTGETSDPRYRDFSVEDLHKAYREEATFVALDEDAHYIAPLWMSEFGVYGRDGVPAGDKTWFINTIQYLTDNDIDFAYWPLVGYLGHGNTNGWALINWDKGVSPAVRDGLLDGNDWRKDAWMGLVNSNKSKTGVVPEVSRWQMLNLDKEDYVKSLAVLAQGDWDNGAGKAVCPDGLRLVGLSNATPARGLCTNSAFGSLKFSRTEKINDERYVANDWASGYAKYQCADGQYAIGYSIRSGHVSSVLCAQTDKALASSSSRTLWFNKGDNRGDNPLGGDWASHQSKGQCAPDEYIAGIAWTTSWGRSGAPSAILCRK